MTLKQKIHDLRKEIGVMTKTKENPFFKSLYFDINDLVEHLEPYLEQQKVMILQPLVVIEGRTAVKTILFDMESDEVNESVALLPDGLDSQKMGGAITFLRRYSIKSLLFLREEDDDANKASGNKVVAKPVSAPVDEPPFYDEEPKPVTAQRAYPEKVVGAKCPNCPTGVYVRSPKTGKVFCDKKCFATK